MPDTHAVNADDSAKFDLSARYAKCIEVSKRVRWDIERHVIRGRGFDLTRKFLPDGLTFAPRLEFLAPEEQRFYSQVQGRTYANMFGLCERFINAKMLEVSRDHWLGDQAKLEALVRFSEEELKHQALFRRIESMMASTMPAGYRFIPMPDDVAGFVLGKSTWSVLGLTLMIELFTQVHYRESLDRDPDLSDLYRDVFLFHWKEESQHAILDELEWQRENEKLDATERDAAVDDLIELAAAVDGMVQAQADEDTRYFIECAGRPFSVHEALRIKAGMLEAYRYQYIVSGVKDARFNAILGSMITPQQAARIGQALAPILQ
ncbi:hypothetical protein [Usitatibacter palustris]|uniref:p-aminobenzoate N-oxygenase AurF n=1 Tax=Usitatibacter palustris TaxID=2732487 RepID=A0A6M4HAP9_9PROT|nr:hypothetical protein [Usitatibacter palustris]QJR15117.1 hypothetical protein DSM104440_01934 [Usitatibacter palustris]